ncbi:MAG TPA: hypothetical protein VKM55_23165 [Candidatus Lokiarchaeia archaeon]|nr:hypothetical protein [Candidatus Lokiarchaeia archaeon]
MAEIIIPIGTTNLKSILPADDEITYSTLANVGKQQGNKLLNWKSHVLVTQNGFAMTIPDANKKLNGRYFSWVDVAMIRRGIARIPGKKNIITRWHFLSEGYGWSVWYDDKSESEEQFSERSIAFGAKVIPVIIQRKEEWLAANKASADKKKRKIVEKGMRSAQKWQKKI